MGFVHIYCGEGKGKTTAATGLAIRSVGWGKKVAFTQFLKNGDSGEIKFMEKLSLVTVLHTKENFGFVWDMTQEEKQRAKIAYTQLLQAAFDLAQSCDLFVLDEVIPAIDAGFVKEEQLISLINDNKNGPEIVLTGRSPSENLLALAAYVSRINSEKHPFDDGIISRKGIEF